jgi:hypothetical protein
MSWKNNIKMGDRKTGYENAKRSGSCPVAGVSTISVERSSSILVFVRWSYISCDRLCGLVVKVPDYRFRGPGSIPAASRFFVRSSGSGTGSTQPRDDN